MAPILRARPKVTVARVVRRALILWARTGRDDGPPRVYLLLLNAGSMGGTIRATHNLAAYLAQSHEVEIISMIRRREQPFFPFPAGVKVTTIDDLRPSGKRSRIARLLSAHRSVLMHPADRASSRTTLWTDFRLARALRTRKRGVLIATRPALNLVAAYVAPESLVRIGQDHLNLSTYTRSLTRAIAAGYPKLDALVTLTERDADDYRRAFRNSPLITSIPNASWGFGDLRSNGSARTVVAAGRLSKQKAYARLIAAFARVAEAHPDWHLVIYGRGPRRAHLERLIDRRGLRGNVTLAGPVEDIGGAMASASIFALSSHFEGFPMVLLEAMSVGLPVVSFDCPTGPREIVRSGHNGLLVPEGDVPELAAALIRMIEDEDLRRRCSAGALETAAEYSPDEIGRRWERLIDALPGSR